MLARRGPSIYVREMELHSPQCTVRSLRPEDARSLSHHGNNRKVWLNMRDRFPHPYTEAAGDEYIAQALSNDLPSYAIDVGGVAAGGIHLTVGTDIDRICAELGYWLGEEYWGRGIVTAAIKLLTPHALTALGLVRVFAIPFVENAASCRALEKAGYEREALMRRSAIKDGQIRDQYLYATYR
jgi:[ribosomal protein S5]-alanine N-acetyltransferase